MQGRGPGDRARGGVGKLGVMRDERRTPRKGQSSSSPCGKGGEGVAVGGEESERRAAAWSSGEEGEGEGEEGEVAGEEEVVQGRKMRKKRRRRMGGRRRRGPWVVRHETKGEDETEEEGEVEKGDEERGLDERNLGEKREVGRGVGGLFVCQVTSEQPMASPGLMLHCGEPVLEAGCSHCSVFGAASPSLHPASLSFPPCLLFFPPLLLFLSSTVPSTLPSPCLHHSPHQTGGKRWRQEEKKE